MLKISDLRDKEILNAADGKRLGYFEDLDLDLETGRIKGLIVPTKGKFLGMFGRESELIIPWDKIIKIGMDVILVEVTFDELPILDSDWDIE